MGNSWSPYSTGQFGPTASIGGAESDRNFIWSLEQVGDGHFDKMVRIALSNPDDEVWRYAIGAAGQMLAGDAIRQLAPLSTNPA